MIIINNKIYNRKTATKIYQYTTKMPTEINITPGRCFARFVDVVIYKTKKGRFFRVVDGDNSFNAELAEQEVIRCLVDNNQLAILKIFFPEFYQSLEVR